MRYLKLFESFNEFPDVFNNTLMRGVKTDKDEYIDDPKSRNINTGASSEKNYLEFLKNYIKFGIPDPTKSIHMFFRPNRDSIDMISFYGNSYRVIPQDGAIFGFNREMRNGGLGSTWFYPQRTIKKYLGKDLNIDLESMSNDEITEYQKMLIDSGVVGVLTYEELLKMSKEKGEPLQVWTESPCLHKKI